MLDLERETNAEDEDSFNEADPDENEFDPEEDELEDEELDEEDEQQADEAEEEGEKQAEKDAKDTQEDDKADVRARYERLELQTKETLKKLGIDNVEDPLKALEELAAEADGISPSEYRDKKQKEAEAKLRQQELFRLKAAQDLVLIQSHFPETRAVQDISGIDNFARFALLRDQGLSAIEAYAAANAAKSHASKPVQAGNKSHLRPVSSKGAKDDSVKMTKAELFEYREMFPNLSDKEIIALYKKTE